MTETRSVFAFLALVTLVFAAAPAHAGDNDLVLSRFGEFVRSSDPCPNAACGVAVKDTEGFRDLTRDLGLVFAPRFSAPAETLGEAGFAVTMMTSLSFIDNSADYWQRAVEDRSPSSALFTGHLQVRKGLPFSFELGSDLAYLFASEMFNLGAQLKWALNEGFYYFPDVAVRGTVNTLLGSRDLNLYTAGWDLSISKALNISDVMTITPYLGYQQLHIIASSRVLNAYPQDARPPQFDDSNQGPDETFAPEFVFEQYSQAANRFFLGARLNVWILSFTLEGVYAEHVKQMTLSGGVDF